MSHYETINDHLKTAFDLELESVRKCRKRWDTALPDEDAELVEAQKIAFENLHYTLQGNERELNGSECRNWFVWDQSGITNRNLDRV